MLEVPVMTDTRLLPVVFAAFLPAFAVAQPPTYRVEYLGAGWTATGLNERGDVCGSVSPDGTALLAGVSRSGQPFQLLPLPPGMVSSRAFDINEAGVIVGAVCPNQYVISQPTAAVWRPVANGYSVEVLSPLPGDPYSSAYTLNNLGDIVGGSGFTGWNLSTGVRFTAAGAVSLPPDFRGGEINDQRVVMSGARLLDLDTNQITDIPLPPGIWQGFQSAALNNHNDFCGYVAGNSGCSTFPVRYRQGIGWEFLGGCGTTTSASAINDRGDALTYYSTTASGVSFVGEGYFALGSLIDPSQGIWHVQPGGVNGINNARQILAAARQGASGLIGAVRLTPIVDTCPADLDDGSGDGIPNNAVDVADMLYFLIAFEVGDVNVDLDNDGDPAVGIPDGGVDINDLLFFLARFEGGC
jgi:hypothetical protein